MEMRLAPTMLAVALACAGCANPPPRITGGSADDPCTGNECNVTITAVDCDNPQNTSVDLDKIYVANGNKPVMRWKIDVWPFLAGWSFADGNGIVFKTDTQGELTPRDTGPRVVQFNNKHTGRADYEYGINIVKRGPTAGSVAQVCKQKDPFVVNL